jgi:hypothetical protein
MSPEDFPSMPRSTGKQIGCGDGDRTAPSISISFDLFLHLKKLLRVVVRTIRDSANRNGRRDVNPCAAGLPTGID